MEGKHDHELNCKSRGPAWKLVDYGNSRQGGPLDLQLSWCLCSHSLSNPAWGRKPFVRAIPPDGRGGLMFIATVFLKSKPKLKNTWLKAPVRCSRISAVAPGATASGTPEIFVEPRRGFTTAGSAGKSLHLGGPSPQGGAVPWTRYLFSPSNACNKFFLEQNRFKSSQGCSPSPPRGIIHLAGEPSVKGDGGHHWLVLFLCVCFQIRPKIGQQA